MDGVLQIVGGNSKGFHTVPGEKSRFKMLSVFLSDLIVVVRLVSCSQILECGPVPNLIVALPNVVGALCSTPQTLADAHY